MLLRSGRFSKSGITAGNWQDSTKNFFKEAGNGRIERVGWFALGIDRRGFNSRALSLEQGESERIFQLLKKGLENLIAQKKISNRVAKEFKQLKEKERKMNVKELKRKLAEAERAVVEAQQNLETVMNEIETFVMATDNYDVVLGQEACDPGIGHPDTRRKIKGAKRVFVFNEVRFKNKRRYRTSKEKLEKQEGVNALLFAPDAEFSPVVLFFGFCDDCFRDEYNRGMEAAEALRSQRKDLLIRFSGFHPEGVVDGCGTEINLI